LAGTILATHGFASVVLAQTSAPGQTQPAPVKAAQAKTLPVMAAPHDSTAGLPPSIKTLVTSFDSTRDAYLASQAALLVQLKNATTAAGREAIRAQLQANRAVFLAELKTFRIQLKDDIAALKQKIGREELLRIIDGAYNAATEGGLHHHRGQQ